MGGAKFAAGFLDETPENEELVIIVNTADDEEFYGLHVSPDVDTVLYTLAGIGDWERGWGIRGDTFNCNEMLGRLGLENWFKIGDRDLALNLVRTKLLREGLKLSQVTERVRKALGVRSKILPMTDDRVRTMVETEVGVLPFQEYFVKYGYQIDVRRVWFEGIDRADPLPEVIRAIRESDIIAIAPSNPVVSIGPILGLKGVKEELIRSPATRVAVSPIIGGKTVKGPADKMLQMLGVEPTAYGVYTLYRDIIDIMVIDVEDAKLARKIEVDGKQCLVLNTRMHNRQDARKLASQILIRIKRLFRK
ncbi:2-phospho-L-lactate transferase [Candidatus Calditenuaceae archaeon HR02]|nr:2-phospho-L-lactate transferase [Candidatus Calditenuaceae archaeon HR02]